MTSLFKPTLHTLEDRLPPAALSASFIVSRMSSINIGVVLPGGGGNTDVPVSPPPAPPTVPPPPPPTGGM